MFPAATLHSQSPVARALCAQVYLKRIYRSAELFFANNTNNFADATMCYEHWSE